MSIIKAINDVIVTWQLQMQLISNDLLQLAWGRGSIPLKALHMLLYGCTMVGNYTAYIR